MESFTNLVLAGVLSGSVLAVIVGFLLQRAKTRIEMEVETQFTKTKATIEKEVEIQFTKTKAILEKEVETQFTKALNVFMSQREWQEKSLSELIGPVYMHLDRTSKVAARYRITTYKEKGKSYYDAMLMRKSNEEVRSLLLGKGYLLPETLRSYAHKLVAHYDLWLSRFDAKLNEEKPTSDSIFDIGFTEESFPEDALKAFQDAYNSLRKDLYGIEASRNGDGTMQAVAN